MILLVDNFDSFTFNLVDYFLQLNAPCEVVRNNVPPMSMDFKGISGIVFSPGPGTPDKAGYLMQYVDMCCQQMPMLGICLGHQGICSFFGGTLRLAARPMHGKVSKIIREDNPIFSNLPTTFNVVRYHSLVCSDLPDSLQILAKTEEDEIMAIGHRKLPIWGLQFHPEAALTENGLQILKNWLVINDLAN